MFIDTIKQGATSQHRVRHNAARSHSLRRHYDENSASITYGCGSIRSWQTVPVSGSRTTHPGDKSTSPSW